MNGGHLIQRLKTQLIGADKGGQKKKKKWQRVHHSQFCWQIQSLKSAVITKLEIWLVLLTREPSRNWELNMVQEPD
jgi:hypothetical protein